MKATRLEAFSDGVIAILITIMVLELKVPHDPTPAALPRRENHAPPLSVAMYGGVATACSLSFYLLRRALARHHDDNAGRMSLHGRMARKNLLALALYSASIPLAWLFVPLSLGLIALPAVMYFLPDRRVEALSTT